MTDPQHSNLEALCRRIYEIYADYVMKNPFHVLEQPIRFERMFVCLYVILVRHSCNPTEPSCSRQHCDKY